MYPSHVPSLAPRPIIAPALITGAPGPSRTYRHPLVSWSHTPVGRPGRGPCAAADDRQTGPGARGAAPLETVARRDPQAIVRAPFRLAHSTSSAEFAPPPLIAWAQRALQNPLGCGPFPAPWTKAGHRGPWEAPDNSPPQQLPALDLLHTYLAALQPPCTWRHARAALWLCRTRRMLRIHAQAEQYLWAHRYDPGRVDDVHESGLALSKQLGKFETLFAGHPRHDEVRRVIDSSRHMLELRRRRINRWCMDTQRRR